MTRRVIVHGGAAALLRSTLFSALLLAAMPALAQERPQTMPTRDVTVTYQIAHGGATLQERTSWLAEAGLQRVDSPGQGLYFLMDHRSRRAWLINDDRHAAMDMALPAGAPGMATAPLEPNSNARFVRRGTDSVAGQTCTEWETTSGGPDTTLCLTDDGVLLRVQANGRTMAEATSVTYGPADPAAFHVPDGYTHVAPPPGPPPGAAARPPASVRLAPVQ